MDLSMVGSASYTGLAALSMLQLFAFGVFMLFGLLMLPAFVLAGLSRRRIERLHNNQAGTVIAQYDPPRGLSPAEMGLLYDMKCGKNEMIATLFDLQQRGVITIKGLRDIQITDPDTYKSLQEYEQIAIRLANGATSGLDTPRKIPIVYYANDQEKRTEIQLPPKKSMHSFARSVQKSISNKGIATNSYYVAFFLRVVVITILIGLLPMLSAALGGTYNDVAYSSWSKEAFIVAIFMTVILGLTIFPVYICVASLFVYLWTRIAGRYWLNSKQARAIWPELEGYRLFLKQVDLDNIQFESTSKIRSYATKTLPYAMIFGLDTKWRERIKNGSHIAP